jgi:hypothetical protein
MTPGYQHLEHARRAPDWVYSPRLRCVGYEWSILTNDPLLVDSVTSLYEACLDGEPGPAGDVFILYRHTDADATSVSVDRNDRAILHRAPAELAIAHLVWHVNRGVVADAGNRLLLHAAAAERDGKVVLIAGPEGSGKSTLVTALVCSGLQYVTDETVAIEVPATTIAPYPKPIAVDRVALESLGRLFPIVPSSLEAGDQWLIPPQAIRPGAVAPSNGSARVLVLPAYRPGQDTAARSIPRGEAAAALAEQSFNFHALGPGRLDVIAEVLRGCDCYRLDVGDLGAACRLVLDRFNRAGVTR